MGGVGQVDGQLDRLRPWLALELGDGLRDHLDVEVVADGGDVAGLVAAEQVPRPADLQVPQRDLEPGAELGVVADGAQALVGLLGEDPVDGMEQIGVGPLAGPSHPAAQLVELPQAEEVGPIDDQRVDGGHVDARLDDGRAHQHVVRPLPEVEHHLLEGALVHLAMGDRHPRLGHHGPQPFGHRVDVLDPVVHVEDLSLAQELAANGLGGGGLVELAHVGEDGEAGGRRGVDHGQVADAGEGHLQRAGDGVGGEGEDVDALGQRLDRLLVGDPEALLLVHHQQPQLLEGDVAAEEPVGADDDVHRPVGQPGQDLARLRRW